MNLPPYFRLIQCKFQQVCIVFFFHLILILQPLVQIQEFLIKDTQLIKISVTTAQLDSHAL